ncbi:MAG: GFA family protein [Rhodobacteraceae bacterium]|nr:GFA family protein [Paracoccaceae bacterium]
MRIGRCLCGAVTYSYEGEALWTGHCWCESCRRATSSPVTTFLGVPKSAFSWTGMQPKPYKSSPGVNRWFCPECGAPMAYDNDKWPDEIHLYAATLDDPHSFWPEERYYFGERLPWSPAEVDPT